jgi:hypothetical protein
MNENGGTEGGSYLFRRSQGITIVAPCKRLQTRRDNGLPILEELPTD